MVDKSPLSRLWAAICTCLLCLFTLAMALQASANNVGDPDLQAIRAILEKPNNQIDLARAKLTIDRMIDPAINIERNLKRLDEMVNKIQTMLPPNPTSLQKMETLIRYLYSAGPWNNNQPFKYDLNDPFGQNIRNKLLPTYLATKRGNCISMPFLFIILGQKLGLDVTASTAPNHVHVKYRFEDGVWRNFEATSGGPKLDSSYQRESSISQFAIENGVYLKPLSKKETVVIIANTLTEFYAEKNQQERRIALANMLLKAYPMEPSSMLHQIVAHRDLMVQEFSKYASPSDIPPPLRPRYIHLVSNMASWNEKLFAIGWRPPSQTGEFNYRQMVQQEKAKQ